MIQFFAILLYFISSAYADFDLDRVSFNCIGSKECKVRQNRFKNLRGNYRSIVHLRQTLKILAADGGYQYFRYQIHEMENKNQLDIFIKLKPVVTKIHIGFLDRSLEMDPSQLISIREGDFFNPEQLDFDVKLMKQKLEGMGYPNLAYDLKLNDTKPGEVWISIALSLGRPRVFRTIKTEVESTYISDFLHRKFNVLYGKPFDLTKFKLFLDEAQKDLFTYGYYLLDLDFQPKYDGANVDLLIKVKESKLFAVNFINLKQENREILHSLVKDLFKKYKRPVPIGTLKTSLEEHYKKRSLLSTDIEISVNQYLNGFKESVSLYSIKVKEKSKTRIKNIQYVGNSFFTKDKLNDFFNSNSYELASLGYYDEEYLDYFSGLLRAKYIEEGFVQAKIIGPTTQFDSLKKFANIEYVIQEGQRTYIRSIAFKGVPSSLEEELFLKMYNKVGNHFNPVKLADDIKAVVTAIQESGYYFAEVTNTNDESFVQYSTSGTEVDLSFEFKMGPLVKLNRIIYLGNDQTRKKVLQKKIFLRRGDLITPTKTRGIESALSTTGLFSNVSVTPIKHNSRSAMTDLVVKVTEREYGLMEVAPGFRTDIGIKLSGTVSYLNLGGMNRSLTLKGQVNQRIDYQTFDERRRKERRELVEFTTALNYNQGDIFDSRVDLGMGLSFQRVRFFDFDADISTYNTTLTRQLFENLSSSLRYQLENISQSDATNERENGTFRIGAITPSLTWDLRNSQVNPVKGAFFNLSCEFANPYFLSQKTDELSVNYYKLISRNRFYLPYKNGTIAVSLVAGVQENLANDVVKDSNGNVTIDEDGAPRTEGYIPIIKVFRLTGMDIVRGFNDEEINRLPDGNDIGTARITDRAFMTNFKLEPRYFINDALMAGLFLDAGRVEVNQLNLGELRTSSGVTFKVITPVGTLDFDYGVKLDRKRVGPSKKLEDAGRFHLSIGFF